MGDRPTVYVLYTRYARSVAWALKLGEPLAPVLDAVAAREARAAQAREHEEGPSASR